MDIVEMATHVLRDSLLATRPFVVALLSSNTLEGHVCLLIEIALWVLSSVIGEETVGEKICGRIERKERQWACKVMPVGSNRVLDAINAKLGQDRNINAVLAARHVKELLEIIQSKGYGVTTT
jgi:hypothetical protein